MLPGGREKRAKRRRDREWEKIAVHEAASLLMEAAVIHAEQDMRWSAETDIKAVYDRVMIRIGGDERLLQQVLHDPRIDELRRGFSRRRLSPFGSTVLGYVTGIEHWLYQQEHPFPWNSM